jgi:hypothetical protein
MNETNAGPALQTRRLTSATGSYVGAAWSHGKYGHIPGFVRRREALRWIETMAHSRASEQTRASFRFVAA